MIDSEVIKILDYPDNSITVQAYDVQDVMGEREFDHSKILLEVLSYVEGLAESTESVPEYLNNHQKTGTTIWDHPDYKKHLAEIEKKKAKDSGNPEQVAAVEDLTKQLADTKIDEKKEL